MGVTDSLLACAQVNFPIPVTIPVPQRPELEHEHTGRRLLETFLGTVSGSFQATLPGFCSAIANCPSTKDAYNRMVASNLERKVKNPRQILGTWQMQACGLRKVGTKWTFTACDV